MGKLESSGFAHFSHVNDSDIPLGLRARGAARTAAEEESERLAVAEP
jgi:hypothetical protein